jgi:hypothetical protein
VTQPDLARPLFLGQTLSELHLGSYMTIFKGVDPVKMLMKCEQPFFTH